MIRIAMTTRLLRLERMTGRRTALVQQRTALRNRIHSALAMRLIETPESLFDSAGQDWLAKLLPELDAQGQLLITSACVYCKPYNRKSRRWDHNLPSRVGRTSGFGS